MLKQYDLYSVNFVRKFTFGIFFNFIFRTIIVSVMFISVGFYSLIVANIIKYDIREASIACSVILVLGIFFLIFLRKKTVEIIIQVKVKFSSNAISFTFLSKSDGNSNKVKYNETCIIKYSDINKIILYKDGDISISSDNIFREAYPITKKGIPIYSSYYEESFDGNLYIYYNDKSDYSMIEDFLIDLSSISGVKVSRCSEEVPIQ